MRVTSTYGAKICNLNRRCSDTAKIYREATQFFIDTAMKEWDLFSCMDHPNDCVAIMEALTHQTKKRSRPKYNFDQCFAKFPSYLRRAAIKEGVGKVSSYKSNYANWEASGRKGNQPGFPRAGYAYPSMYKDNMYNETGTYTAEIKLYNHKTKQWDWVAIFLKKTDIDYIQHHCSSKKKLAPALTRRGKEWLLDFPFQETSQLHDTPVLEQVILSVDLGINNACTCVAMTADGAVHGRHFLQLPVETDHLDTAINRIKKAQQHGAYRTPRLCAVADGINEDITRKTANFIIGIAVLYSVDTIVFEHLSLDGKKRGSKKQKLHLWKARDVQDMVEHKAHKLGMRIRRVCAWGTSRLAFDGTGAVKRGTYMQDGVEKYNYSICVFKSGKIYNCDLNAAYNIGARYFVRELLKSVPEKVRLELEAKVPSATKRTTATLSTLISLYATFKPVDGTSGSRKGTFESGCVA